MSEAPDRACSRCVSWRPRAAGHKVKGFYPKLLWPMPVVQYEAFAATCGKVCVVEVEEVVPAGSLDPDCIHLPGVYVQRMILGAPYDKKIEFRTVRPRAEGVGAA